MRAGTKPDFNGSCGGVRVSNQVVQAAAKQVKFPWPAGFSDAGVMMMKELPWMTGREQIDAHHRSQSYWPTMNYRSMLLRLSHASHSLGHCAAPGIAAPSPIPCRPSGKI